MILLTASLIHLLVNAQRKERGRKNLERRTLGCPCRSMRSKRLENRSSDHCRSNDIILQAVIASVYNLPLRKYPQGAKGARRRPRLFPCAGRAGLAALQVVFANEAHAIFYRICTLLAKLREWMPVCASD